MWPKKLLEFILFGSLFIASCAVAFCMETNIVFGLPFNHFSFYCFVFGATLVQYNLHYISKKVAVKNSERLSWSLRNQNTHMVLLFAGIALILFSFFRFHLKHFGILLTFAGIAFVYSYPVIPFGKRKRIKDYGVLKIITLSLLWTLVTVWFPVTRMNVETNLFIFVFVKRFVFMFILCLLFDIRDIQIDGKEHIHTMAVFLGRKKSYLLAYAVLLLFIGLSIAQYVYFPASAFLPAMLLSAAATLVTIELTRKSNSDFVYLAGIDGMMLLQAALVYLFSLKQ